MRFSVDRSSLSSNAVNYKSTASPIRLRSNREMNSEKREVQRLRWLGCSTKRGFELSRTRSLTPIGGCVEVMPSRDMISCWAAVGLLHGEQRFRRVRGYRYLSLLKRALRGNSSKLDGTEKAA